MSESSIRSSSSTSSITKRDGAITASDLERAAAQSVRKPRRNRQYSPTFAGGRDQTSIHANINDVLDARTGSVLDSRSILKTDYVPASSEGSNFPVRIYGTSNLRQSATTRIFAVAQPTISGTRGILNLLGAGRMSRTQESVPRSDRKSVLWINLREEPLLYVNGRSTVLRDRSEPFHNIDQLQGIDPKRIHDLEYRLKEDVVEEAALYNGNIVLHEETRRRELEESWEAVTLNDIRSPEEVFFSFNMQGYRVKYVRIPSTPEKAPTAKFFDMLVQCLMDTNPETLIVLNCQTGISRSTIGMVAAGLVQMWRGIIEIPKQVKLSKSEQVLSPTHKRIQKEETHIVRMLSGLALSSLEEGLDMQGPNAGHDDESSNDAVSRQLEAGWYQPTLNLIRVIDAGRQAKKHVDFFCEDASHLVNLRSIIFVLRLRASRERHQVSEKYKLIRAATALLRYLMLISFDSYLRSQVNEVLQKEANKTPRRDISTSSLVSSSTMASQDQDSKSHFPMSFARWLTARPELLRLLEMVENDPATALEALDAPGSIGPDDSGTMRKDMREAMEARRGSMLNTDTILKADHYLGGTVERKAVEMSSGVSIRGAPNFRVVQGTRVIGVCTPSVDAAAAIVRYVQAASNAQKLVWTNLREEAVIYINKMPYVLRSVKQPFRNASDFVMINPERLEAAEKRLKDDILAEARRYNGRILVHSETDARSLQLFWEQITEEDVMTPRELFESLVEAGLPVDYARIPLTPEQPPSAVDIDCILERVRKYKNQTGTHFVFNCHLGRGRSTTAMAIALLELQRNDDPSSEFFEDILAFGQKAALKHQGEETAPRHVQDRRTAIEDDMTMSDEEEAPSMDFPHSKRELATSSQPTLKGTHADHGHDDSSDEDDERFGSAVGTSHGHDEEFGVILGLVRVLKDGITARKWADIVTSRCGEVENLRANITEYMERSNRARSTNRANELIEKGLLNLRRFFMIVVVAAYEMSFAREEKEESFSRWYFRRPEIQTIFKEIQGKDSLRFASVDRVLSGPPPTEQNELAASEGPVDTGPDETLKSVYEFVARRNGMVLTRGSILKSDHFTGCNRLKNAKVVISGGPNFREIVTSDDPSTDVGIYGTGIPTVDAVRGILKHVSHQRDGKGEATIIWSNLREEPIVYVNKRPFVLRKLEHPFENLEHTGISKDRVEDMEDRLKVDIINEILNNGGRLLLHDEDESGLQPLWVNVDISEGSTSVQTPRDLYDMLANEYQVIAHRCPITDEQAPKASDYDEIAGIIRQGPGNSELIFNCQLGRGRTTTGLVIATLVRLWDRKQLRPFARRFDKLVKSGKVKTKSKIRNGIDLEPEVRLYLDGQYEAVGALTRVLEDGIQAKITLDAVIDACDAMQNLREAIYNLKVVSEDVDEPPVKQAAALNRGIHYLRRYYQLIEFVSYLFSLSPDDRTSMRTFASWLRGRSELKSILRRVALT